MDYFILPLGGGVLIGISVSLMLLWNGRVTGVSGIVSGALQPAPGDLSWRFSFLGGLLAGGTLLELFYPEMMATQLNRSLPTVVMAGLLVGFGTVMGSGCTSGHGICGLSRLSRRSILATGLFMLFGIVSATLYRHVVGD